MSSRNSSLIILSAFALLYILAILTGYHLGNVDGYDEGYRQALADHHIMLLDNGQKIRK